MGKTQTDMNAAKYLQMNTQKIPTTGQDKPPTPFLKTKAEGKNAVDPVVKNSCCHQRGE
jgi:hypothetical protein